MNNEYDLIIVGAGVVGCAAARAFGQDGRKVLLLERDLSEPDRIVGELMQPGGMRALKKLGMENCTEGIEGINCFGYSVYRNGELVELPYTFDHTLGKQARGISFHHGRFIQKLRQSAAGTENVTIMQRTVSELIVQDSVSEKVIGVITTEHEKFYAPLTLVADGIFSKFRKEFTDTKTQVTSHFVGFLIHDLDLPFPQKGFVCLGNPSFVLMYQISPNETRVLVDVPGELPQVSIGELKKYMQNVVCPELPLSIQAKFLEALETERLRPMPSGFLPPTINQRDGTILLGDALNVRSPLTGGGMTVALEDVLTCRDLLSKENVPSFTDTDLVLQAMNAFHWKRKRYSAVINVLAMALYSVFAAGQSSNMMVLQYGCFEYFKLGEAYTQGPMDLLSGLNHSPLALIYHFFSVAFYGIYFMLKQNGVSKMPQNIWRSLAVFYTACITIMPFLWGELKG
ncbi:squalene epoxidase-domain-containing protein [Gilbertella persicaria]|uniref:Squalene monooxygenase n=1 Tax=Rhizopus stolonifer TaxID=4846 RepID=A0A367J1E8_RHIST|nr:squalene epoxidase-domain-containing protein [Gilbertella persicaria]KAI8064313.1 squalene epoxidase-domain-containing protein [Gilbertella persicaria]RCH83740.1 Squalene epoxidase [Rhizopus stolonifer]